ncbi:MULTISPECIES: DUF6653 family protein [Natrialbaceae]|uniref:DUF6653 family protein n=1 Tax=Natrialbaceae TaxID=1644061 RepID=UPI00207C3F67|nr:DUF6653 family protein [Natronococcus sp. CG52]
MPDRFAKSLSERYFWSRHANPGSVWTFVLAYPTLVLAIYRRDRRLLLGTLGFVAVNPLLFAPPADDEAWATRVVLGERAWLEQGSFFSANALFVAASAPVYLYTLRAAVQRRPLGTAGGTVLSLLLMLLFFRRMARLYEEGPATEPER